MLLRYAQELVSWAYESKSSTGIISTEEDAYHIRVRFNTIISKYQEQSELLDPILGSIVKPMLQCFQEKYVRGVVPKSQSPFKIPKPMDHLCNIIYNLCNVRGSDTIVKFFPHEVEDLEHLVDLLEGLSIETHQWYIKLVLYHWLSIVVIVPFDLDTIDSNKKNGLSLL